MEPLNIMNKSNVSTPFLGSYVNNSQLGGIYSIKPHKISIYL